MTYSPPGYYQWDFWPALEAHALASLLRGSANAQVEKWKQTGPWGGKVSARAVDRSPETELVRTRGYWD